MDEQPSSDVKAQRNNTSDSKPSEGEKATKQQVKRVPPDVLCSCPQRCDTRVPAEARTKLYSHFSKLGDHATQNAYLQSYIEMRSVYRRLWAEEEKVRGRLPRRVSCKYRIPISEMPPIENVDFPKPKLITNSKGKETFVMTARGKGKTIEVCQKAFMNVYGITEKRVRLQREKLIDRLRNRSPPPLSPIHHYMDEDLSSQMEEEEDGTLAVAIVDSFFQNQLWKPEYIGMGKEKIEHIKA